MTGLPLRTRLAGDGTRARKNLTLRANGASMLSVHRMSSRTYSSRRHQAEVNTVLREMRAGRDHDLCREAPLDEHRFTDRRVHCANRNKVKGSTKTNRYFPERRCRSCGSTKTILRYFQGHQIYWDKWMRLQKRRHLTI